MQRTFTIMVRGRKGVVDYSTTPLIGYVTVTTPHGSAMLSCKPTNDRMLTKAVSLLNRIYYNAPRQA